MIENKEMLNVEEFVGVFVKGVEIVYKVVMKLVEGIILIVVCEVVKVGVVVVSEY